MLVTDDDDDARAALDHFATQTYGFGIDAVEQIQTFAAGTPDAVTARLASFIDAGAQHLVCRIGVLGPDGFIEQLQQLRTITDGAPMTTIVRAGTRSSPDHRGPARRIPLVR